MNQMKLVTDFVGAVAKQKKAVRAGTIQIIIDAANRVIAEESRELVKATPGMGLRAWLQSDDTGLSSRFMAHVLAGGPAADNHHPLDAADFGRCYRFLRAIEYENLDDLQKMKDKSPEWCALVMLWSELEKLYESQGNGKNSGIVLTKFMGAILAEAGRVK